MAHQQGVWIGLLQVAGVTVVLSGGLWVLFSGLIARTGMRLGRLLHLVPRLPPPGPLHPSLETVAADLHRIRHDLETWPPGVPMAKRLGTLQAYDDRLLDACRALEVPDTLAGLPEGIDRDTERLRVESRLEEAGLRVSHRG